MKQKDNAKQMIKESLKAKKISQTAIAKMLKVTVVSVNDVLSGKRRTPRIRKAISLAINIPESEIWPDKQNTPALHSSMVAKKG